MLSNTPMLRSNYYNSLQCPEIKARYDQKISEIDGLDPYTVKKSDWSGEMEKFPEITWPDLVMYLVFGVNEFTINKDQFKAFKSLEAYNQFVCGWVRDIVVKEFPEKSLCLLSCRTMHSQRMSEKALHPWIVVEQGGTIRSAHCDCMAGLGETCTHVASLLFAIEYYIRKKEKATVTEEKAYWLVPSVKKVPYAEVVNIDFTSAKTKKKIMDSDKPTERSQVATTPKQMPPTPTASEQQSFLQRLHESGTKSAILSLVQPYSKEFVPKIASKTYPNPLTLLSQPELYGKPYKEISATCQNIDLTVTKQQSRAVERDTKEQARTKLWFAQRAGRITASKMKSVCHTDPRKPSQSLVRQIVYPDLYRFSSTATQWGCTHEKTARDKYEEYMTTEEDHTNFYVSDSGLVIDTVNPHIGASPDGYVHCTCCGNGCIEIKCPYCAKDCTLEETAENKRNFCLVKNAEDELKLDKTHAYYYQIQTQIHVTGANYCDFVLWTPNDLHYERIEPDFAFWSRIQAMATQFFKMCLLPELVARFYTYEKLGAVEEVNDLVPEVVCYCGSVAEDGMRECEVPSCSYKLFHDSCLGYNDLILTEYNQKRTKWECPDCSIKCTVAKRSRTH
ncbi:uncharacterized protein [Amphiura filiformis]|uniref:uncharacterized protein n=1 Tax=Amphiura filiformis TaxID=82378 RepID=UPI003B21D78E